MKTFLEILSIIIYILCLPLLFILLVYIRINELLKGRKQMVKGFLNFVLNIIAAGIEIALIAKIVEILIVTKTSFTFTGVGCIFLDCSVIGLTTYGLIKDIKEMWED